MTALRLDRLRTRPVAVASAALAAVVVAGSLVVVGTNAASDPDVLGLGGRGGQSQRLFPPPAGTSAGAVQIMSIVAHPDDDLFFFNPDIAQGIKAGQAVVTVYVTASEVSGNGSTPAQKALSLQKGVEDAYARMAGIADANPGAQEEWTGESWTIGSRQVEKAWLTDRPNVQLVFMNLHDTKLDNVYGSGFVDKTIIPQGSTVGSYSYGKADVISVLAAIIDAYRPSVLRYQDTDPDWRYTKDHEDHTAAGKFSRDAVARYGGQLVEVQHRNYNILDLPGNLSPAETVDKSFILDQYAAHDAQVTPLNWLERQYYRWPRGTQWATRNGSGRPQAFVVRRGVATTYEENPDGTWSTGLALPDAGGPLMPTIVTMTDAGGAVHIFAQRADSYGIITLVQSGPPGSWPGAWTGLGKPSTGTGARGQVGVPAVVAQADGAIWVVVENGSGGVGAKRQNADGTWPAAWASLGGGTDVLVDGLAAIRGEDGKVEVFATTYEDVRTYRQAEVNGSLVATGQLPMPPGVIPASPAAVTKSKNGALEVFYRAETSDEFIATWQTGVGGAWTTAPVSIGGPGGLGPATLVAASPASGDRVTLFARTASTSVGTNKQLDPDAEFGGWGDLGGTIVEYPAATTNAGGLVYVFGLGPDGRLYARKQVSAEAYNAFQEWAPVG